MKLFVSLCMSAVFLFSAVPSPADSPDRPEQNGVRVGQLEVIPNLVIIKLRAHASFTTDGERLGIRSLDHILDRIGAKAVETFNTHRETALQKAARPAYNIDRMVKVRYTSSDHPALLAQEIAADASVEYAEPYFIFPFHYTPNDPQLGNQWAVDVLKLEEAWDVTTGDSTIVIANVDSGVDWKHEDLAENIWINPGEYGVDGELKNNGVDDDNNGKIDDWHGWDFIGDGSSQSPQPDNDPMDGSVGHGTSTSGCHSARTDNGIGIAGSSFRAKILAIKAASNNSSGIAGGYEGIVYAGQMGADIINCSWGGSSGLIRALQDIVDDVTDMGSLVVSSSGNDPVDNDYAPRAPSSLNHVLNVGSVESNGNASGWCTYGTTVHIYSPGNGIRTTRRGAGYTSPTGTSFSGPLAAGVAALVKAVHPDWTPDQIATQLRVTADRFDAPATSKRYGRLNAYRAVTENDNLDDIPGIRIKDFQYSIDGGNYRFTEPGQSARLTVVLENVLAPTSTSAAAYIDLDDASVSTTASDFSLAGMETFDTKSIEFDVQLAGNPEISEGYIPIRIRIEDGEYVDFLAGRIPVYLNDAWHTSLNFGVPYITSIDAASVTSIWATANVQNQDLGLRSLNGGGSWSSIQGSSGYPSGRGVYCIEALTNNVALVGTGPSNGAAEVYRTVNSGSSWSGTSVSSFTGFINWIHMYDGQNGILQGDPKNGVWGIATTVDGGESWTPIANSVSAPTGEAGWNNSYAAAGDTLWFGTNNGKIYRSTDRGQNWTSITTPSKHSVDMVFADSKRGAIRFTTQENQGGSNMLAVTTDGGDTWNEVKSIQVSTGGTIEIEPDGRRLWFIQGTNAWMSTNMGEDWTVQAVPGNFGLITASTAFANSSLTDIYAAGLNIFKYRSNFQSYQTTSAAAPPSAGDFALDFMYPNPVSAASAAGLTIGFTLDRQSVTRVDVFDNLGRLVRSGIEARLDAGSHTFNLQTDGLGTGNYRVRVQAGDRVAISNLVVMH